ncbi:hypothetical protein ACFFV7_41130 [Nonomuraea spiralis]|uniref:Uncharacterized protein n=1 Tax=Nonomuraea spiralis TaxID=46182 RepID=A0ABV5IT11_9ACTN|nr:hypothetical protein [Nonomuraea spiralis]
MAEIPARDRPLWDRYWATLLSSGGGERERPVPSGRTRATGAWLDLGLAAASASAEGRYREVHRGRYRLRLEISAGDHVQLSVSAPLPQKAGVDVLPVWVSDGEGTRRYLLALQAFPDELYGLLRLPRPNGTFVAADVDGQVLSPAEVAAREPEEVLRSLRATATTRGIDVWKRIAADFPDGHPVRAVLGV